ncbi:MAG: hypothetical protein ABL883_08465 [Terricaulis sp.]
MLGDWDLNGAAMPLEGGLAVLFEACVIAWMYSLYRLAVAEQPSEIARRSGGYDWMFMIAVFGLPFVGLSAAGPNEQVSAILLGWLLLFLAVWLGCYWLTARALLDLEQRASRTPYFWRALGMMLKLFVGFIGVWLLRDQIARLSKDALSSAADGGA